MAPIVPLLAAASTAAGAAGVAGISVLGMSAGTLATIGSIGGLLTGVMSGIQAKQTGDFNAKMARREGVIAKQQADFEASQADRQARLRAGTNIARASAGGGSLDIIASNAAQEKLNILNIEQSGVLAQQNAEAEASLSKSQGNFGLATGILDGMSSVAGSLKKAPKTKTITLGGKFEGVQLPRPSGRR
jgi:hypothetical protein